MGQAAEHPGTTPACSGRRPTARAWLRRATTLLPAAALLAGLVQFPTAARARAQTSSGARTTTVDVNSFTPAVPGKGSTLRISGTVTNNTRQAIIKPHVGVRIASGNPLTSRSAIAWTSTHGTYGYSDGVEIGGHTASLPDIPAGISEPFTLSVPIKALRMGGDGVYQLGISASGRTRGTPYDHILGITRTFLPWYPHASAQKIQTTYLWPLIDRPHLDIRTPGDQQQAPLLRDDALAAELAPGGRLEEMVSLAKNLPVTWVIDPDLLATVDAMTKPYKVLGPQGDITHTTPGQGTAYAKQWLNELQHAVQGHEVIALPFGDPDIASIAHHGRNVSGTVDHLKTATNLATATVQTVLGVTPRTDVAWPADGALDPSIVRVARATGARYIISRSDSLRETRSLSYTPSAARPIGHDTTAIVADAALSQAFTSSMTTADDFTLSVRRFLAQSLLIHEQAPHQQRSIVVAPQRMPTASQAQAMAAAISAADAGGWTEPVPLGTAARATADPNANHRVPSGAGYPAYLHKQELGTDAFRQVQTVQDSLNSFLVILSRKDRVTTPFGTAVLRSMSTQWRRNGNGAAAFRDSVASYLSSLTQDVRILPKKSITLSGRTATIPVTVQNSLAQRVTGLQLRLTSSQPNRLTVGQPQKLDIDGGHNHSLKFTATARATVRTRITAQLYTADGTAYGPPMSFEVDITSITDTVMLVIAGGLLLLVLAGVRRYRKRKHTTVHGVDGPGTAEAAGDEVAAGPAASAAGTAAEAPQPGDPEPNTAAEDADASSAGEKVER